MDEKKSMGELVFVIQNYRLSTDLYWSTAVKFI